MIEYKFDEVAEGAEVKEPEAPVEEEKKDEGEDKKDEE